MNGLDVLVLLCPSQYLLSRLDVSFIMSMMLQYTAFNLICILKTGLTFTQPIERWISKPVNILKEISYLVTYMYTSKRIVGSETVTVWTTFFFTHIIYKTFTIAFGKLQLCSFQYHAVLNP
jgi:hypothetical protein